MQGILNGTRARTVAVLTVMALMLTTVAFATAVRAGSASTPVVFIATGEDFADGLTSGAAAAVSGGPVLLTRFDSLPAATTSELARLKPDKIYVAGGTAAISDGVIDKLKNYAPVVERLSGTSRYETAAEISKAIFPATIGGGAPGPVGPPGADGTQVRVFQKSEPGYFGGNGLDSGLAASLVTLTFDAPSAGTVTLTSSVTAESPGLGSGGLMWLQAAGTCTYDGDLNASQGIWTTKYSSTGATPVTVSMTFVAPVTAGTNSFEVCASVQYASAASAANERAVFRYRNLVGTFISQPPPS